MSHEPYITLTGFVATNPRRLVTQNGVAMTTFRVAVTPRRFERVAGTWIDGTTQWYSVKCFREMAENAAMSVHKGDPVIVYGRFLTSEWTSEDGTSRITLEVDALAMGHDLGFGLGSFRRTSRRPVRETPGDDSINETGNADSDVPESGSFLGSHESFDEESSVAERRVTT